MQIFIMRHGQAEPMAVSDALRNLTAVGIEQAKQSAVWLNEHHPDINCTFVSPYVRAQQTADTVLDNLSSLVKRETLSIITPEDSAKNVHDYLDAICSTGEYQKILLISHMPLVSYLVAELTSDNVMPSFNTAAVAQIDYDTKRMSGEFVTLISPEDLR